LREKWEFRQSEAEGWGFSTAAVMPALHDAFARCTKDDLVSP
jgi:hypothetical protein